MYRICCCTASSNPPGVRKCPKNAQVRAAALCPRHPSAVGGTIPRGMIPPTQKPSLSPPPPHTHTP
jgi:hypothetical protein